MAAHPRRTYDFNLRAYWLGQDAGRIPCLHRPLVRKALAGDLHDRTEVLVHFAAQGAGQRHPEKSGDPAGRNPAAGRRARLLMPQIRTAVRTGDTLMHERQAMLKARRTFWLPRLNRFTFC